MKERHTPYDVSTRVNVTDPEDVNRETRRIFALRYPDASYQKLDQAFRDFVRLYSGDYPGYHACDTIHHDTQHSLDAALAMVRLMDGYEASHAGRDRLGPQRFTLGFIAALFHDAGYIRRRGDRRHKNGAEYTQVHVGRSGRFLRDYLHANGMEALAENGAQIVHYTGYEVPLDRLALPHPKDRMLGCMLGSADIVAQMADRCYLEKCRDRLFAEFELAGVNRRRNPDGSETVLFASPEHLLLKTPEFYLRMRERLEIVLGGVYRYAAHHFGGANLYLEEMDNNMRYLETLISRGNLAQLRRIPLKTPALTRFPFAAAKSPRVAGAR